MEGGAIMATSRYITGPDGALVEAPTAETVRIESDYTLQDNLQDAIDELADGRSLPLGARSTETVDAWTASQCSIGSGAANYGNGLTAAWWLNNHVGYTIAQAGELLGVQLYMPGAVPVAVTAVYVDVWRRRDSEYFQLLQSIDVTASLASGLCDITFATPVDVQINDYMGLHYTATGDPGADWLTINTGLIAASSYRVESDIAKVVGDTYKWLTQTAGTTAIGIRPMMQAPVAVAIGDSITGRPTPGGPAGLAAQMLGLEPYQVLGIGGNRIGQMEARITTDLIDKHPLVAILQGGVNDLGGGTTDAAYKASWVTILAACQTAGIMPIVWGITPWNLGTADKMRQRDLWNAWLETTVPTYGGIYTDPNPAVGMFRTGGDAGNLWDWQPALVAADGLHPSAAGKEALASVIGDVLQWELGGTLHAGGLAITNDIVFDGAQYISGIVRTANRIRVARQPAGSRSVYPYGADLVVEAGGAGNGYAASPGGYLYLNGGIGIGTRGSHVYIGVAAGQGTSATADNVPMPFWRFGYYAAASPYTGSRTMWFADDNTAAAYTNGLYATSAALFATGVFQANGGYQSADGTAGVSGTLVQDDGTTARLTTVIKNGLITGVTVAASSGAAVTWTPAA